MAEHRPVPTTITTGADLRRWYWMKDELVDLARHHGLKVGGGKFQILDRIAYFLDTGERVFPGDQAAQVTSKFDWHTADLTEDTIITDSYKNTQNVRRFLEAQVGRKITFKTDFMAWMKANVGKTMGDAVEAYLDIMNQAKAPGYESRIADHNQFNQYTRDFLADNPSADMKQVRAVWAKKRNLPSDDGRHRYDRSDL
ncbi:MAG: DUF6434 domain-containing protein, partial [Pseudomonadota bacterium]